MPHPRVERNHRQLQPELRVYLLVVEVEILTDSRDALVNEDALEKVPDRCNPERVAEVPLRVRHRNQDRLAFLPRNLDRHDFRGRIKLPQTGLVVLTAGFGVERQPRKLPGPERLY